MCSRSQLGKVNSGKKKLRELLLQADNRTCADCGARDPKWASANIGVFLCLKCCGVHRNLGSHISKVLSVTLDDWDDEEVDAMIEVGGNASANSIYEAHIPEGTAKPGPGATHEQRKAFIRSKYELQDFMKPSLKSLPSRAAAVGDERTSTVVQAALLNQEGMEDSIGMLKVKVVKGTNLAVRDMLSSDPYVVLNMGTQTVQTTVMNSNLNPVWNEELMLAIPQTYGTLKVQVYDHDTFSADDIMGDAEIELQPLISSAMAYGDPEMFGDMQIGKWQKSQENALIEDSIVGIVDGKVKQEMNIQLQNVESGELELELEWMAL